VTAPPAEAPDPIPREYPPVPRVGVAAVVFDPQGRALLVLRSRSPSPGMWGLPGGLLRLGESLRDGVCREVREECGVAIQVEGLAGVFEPIEWDEQGRVRYHYVVVDFWARYLQGEPRAGDDAAAVQWVALEDLEHLPMHPETRQVIRLAHAQWRATQRDPPSPNV